MPQLLLGLIPAIASGAIKTVIGERRAKQEQERTKEIERLHTTKSKPADFGDEMIESNTDSFGLRERPVIFPRSNMRNRI